MKQDVDVPARDPEDGGDVLACTSLDTLVRLLPT